MFAGMGLTVAVTTGYEVGGDDAAPAGTLVLSRRLDTFNKRLAIAVRSSPLLAGGGAEPATFVTEVTVFVPVFVTV